MKNIKVQSPPIALVTGGARGIGKVIARTFAQNGFKVAICDINRRDGEASAEELRQEGYAADFYSADLGRMRAAAALIKRAYSHYGRLDVLVNNARAARSPAKSGMTERAWDQELAVTLRAAYFAGREAIKVMALGGGGSIINISSISAIRATPDSPFYQIAKSGILQLTRCLAVEGGPHAVRVNAVLPGFIVQDEHRERFDRPTNKRYKRIAEFCHPLGTVGSSQDVANSALFFAADGSRFVTGQSLVVDGGLTLREPAGLLFAFDSEVKRP